jgi:uncharacterized protein
VKSQRTRYGFVLRLDAGEEIRETIAAFAGREGLRCAAISGIGAARDLELGYYHRLRGEYQRRRLDDEFEILALTGNLSVLEGAPFVHLHVVLGGADFAALGGHLFQGVVSVTCEVQLVTDPGVLTRVPPADGDFSPLAPAD